MIAESCAFLLISLLACIFLFTGGQTLWSWAKRISWKCESKIRPWSYSLVATPCDFGQESFCESQSKYLWFSVDNWLCETFFSQINHPMKTILVWIDTTWNNFEYIKALWNCFELGYIWNESGRLLYSQYLSISISYNFFCWLHENFPPPFIICRILEYGTHQKMQIFQQVIRDRCSPVKSIQSPVCQPIKYH